MQTTQPTPEDIDRWRKLYETYHTQLKPNRISGAQLYDYLKSHYPVLPIADARCQKVVSANILENECFARELPAGAAPDPVCCKINREGNGLALYAAQDAVFSGIDIFVGIDLVSGYFIVEGSSLLWDELYAQRGLNENNLSNFYCVAEYITCLSRFDQLQRVLSL